jgi:hypothetical protein
MKIFRQIYPVIIMMVGVFLLNSCNWFSKDKNAAIQSRSGLMNLPGKLKKDRPTINFISIVQSSMRHPVK